MAVIREMDLADGIAAARAFSLYFQLINILEQHIEEDTYLESLQTAPSTGANDPFLPALASQSDPATFRQLFERLRSLGVPPAQVENLLRELDIRLVFTAHPTEIVRHTVRHKQRRVACLIQKLEANRNGNLEERERNRQQLEEEIRLWWRTDELHQFKPSVLDEVDDGESVVIDGTGEYIDHDVKEVLATFVDDAHHRNITVTVRGIDLSMAQAGGGH